MKPILSSKFKVQSFVSNKIKKTAAIATLFFLTNYTMQAQSPTVTLTPSQHNGYNITCFGKTDGSITANVTGGMPPYTYAWTNDQTTQTISNLAAGYYSVRVTDAALHEVDADITLTEPELLELQATVFTYPNGYNVSLYNAYNGSIAVTVYGGVAAYNLQWNDGNTNQNRTALGASSYMVTVTDANGCQSSSERLTLTQPERSDWTMTGNAGINSTTNFIGTTDLKSLSFRTNNAERFLIKDNGELKINSFTGDPGMLYTDVDGIIKSSNIKQTQPCAGITAPVWYSNATALFTCPGYKVGIGTYDPMGPLHILHSNANNALIIDRASNTQGETKSQISFRYAGVEKWSTGINAFGTNLLQNDYYIYGGIDPQNLAPRVQFYIAQNGNILCGNTSAWLPNALNSDCQFHIISDINRKTGLCVQATLLNGFGDHYGIHSMVDEDNTKAIVVTNENLPIGCREVFRVYGSGYVEAKDIKIHVAGWCDNVFNKQYPLLSLEKVEQYIDQHKHLPGVPSEAEVVANGLSVADMFTIQMKKIEELTLYMVEQNKKIVELQNQIQILKHK